MNRVSVIQRCKSLAGRIVSGLNRRIWLIAHRRIEQRLAAVEQRLTSIEQHIPAFLNAVSTVGAFGFELRQQQKVLERQTETLGRQATNLRQLSAEAGFAGVTAAVSAAGTEPFIDKGAAVHTNGLMLNLGCGRRILKQYINVDRRKLPGVDIIAEVGNLPFSEGSVREIFSAHMLEHFPRKELGHLLPYWRSLLAPGGRFRAVVADYEAMLTGIAAGTFALDAFRAVLSNVRGYGKEFRLTLLTPDSLTDLLADAGFHSIVVPVRGCRNGSGLEFEIHARRGLISVSH
jgi:hypothetical protein